MPGHSFGAMPDSLTIQEVMKAGAASPGGSNGLPPAGESGGAEGGAAGAVDPSCEELCKDVKCGECGACSTKPRLCSGCWQQWYCSRMHQTQAWQKHKLQCRPWRLESSPDVGRYMVATRNITQGELLMMDPHLIIGPKMITEPVCLACYMPATGEYTCSKCGFPMCSPDCEAADSHEPECQTISKSGIKIKVRLFGEVNSMYECVMPLRILHLRDTNKDLWEKILCLESHLDKRDNTEVMAITQRTVVDILHERLGLIELEDELIHQILGIIDTNAFEIRLPETNIQGVYEAASMLEHACIPNTHRTFDADLNLVVRAAVPIKRGEHLTSNYTDVLYTTQQRQEHLLTSKFFTCRCKRCVDPKELGTFASALRCPTCKEGFLLPDEPISPSCTWKCLKCNEPVDPSYAPGLVSVVQEEAEELESGSPTVASCEAFLNKWSSQFHPNHATFLNVKYALLHLYGADVGYELSQLKPEHILRKELLCREFVTIADILAPGISRLRGSICYELYQSLFYKCKSLFRAKLCSPEAAKKIAQEALMWLMECARVLSYEPPVQPEGQLGIEAKDEMKQMAKWIREEGWKH